MMEKAFAKVYLNWANLEGGMQYEAMRDLTGMPIVLYQTSNMTKEAIWGYLLSAVR